MYRQNNGRRPERALWISLFSFFLLTTSQIHAQEPIQLSPVVISATSTEKQLRDAPATVTVIGYEELQERPVQDLSDALRGTSGVTINSIGLNRRGISIRGMPEEHTLILIDGKRINRATSAIAHADYDLNWMPAEAIERIEVVRGPMSSLYGSDSLGGVVNIITRKATDIWKGSISTKGGLQQGTGGETYQAGSYVGGPIVPGRLGLSVYAEAHGRDMTRDAEDARVSELDARDSKIGSATLTWTPDERQRVDLTYGYGTEKRSYDILSGSTPYTSTDNVQRQHFSLSHQSDWQWGKSTFRAYRSYLYRKNRRTQGTPSGPQKLTDDIVDGHVSVPVLGWNLVTAGGEWRHEQLEDPTVNGFGEEDAEHQALFLQDEIALGDSWSLLLGSRSDHHEKFGWHQSPRTYLVYHATEAFTIKGGVGQGFKAPTLKQLSPGYSASAAGGRFTILGNPDVQPEINTMYEVGAAYDGKDWSLSGSLFQNDLEDLIQTTCIASCGVFGAEQRTYENVDKARIRGIEVGGRTTLTDQLDLEANYVFLRTEDLSTGLELEERPRHSANVAMSWYPTDDLTVRVRNEYVGRQTVDPSSSTREVLSGYAIWSIDVSRQLTESVALKGGIQNLTNVRLSEKSTNYPYAEASRLFWLGLNYSF